MSLLELSDAFGDFFGTPCKMSAILIHVCHSTYLCPTSVTLLMPTQDNLLPVRALMADVFATPQQ